MGRYDIDNKAWAFVEDVCLADNIPSGYKKMALDLLLDRERDMFFDGNRVINPNNPDETILLNSAQTKKIQELIDNSTVGHSVGVESIKEFRRISCWGLKDCKDTVEDPRNFRQKVQS